MNTDRTDTKTAFRLLIALILCLLIIAPAFASAEVITYDYDNAGQVKKANYGEGTTVADTGQLGSGLHTAQVRLRLMGSFIKATRASQEG